ncbi:MAG: hypothetical protein ACRDPB_03115 [Nocardioidaceae bacterium]
MIGNGPEGNGGTDSAAAGAAGGVETLDRAAALVEAAGCRAAADAAEARLLAVAAHWADLHPVLEGGEPDGYATGTLVNGVEELVPLAGEGTPLVAEFAAAEFAATLGMSSDAGRKMLGESLELRHRLPKTWRRIMSGDLPAWRGRRIGEKTMWLCPEAAAFVDGQVAPFAHRLSVGRVDRLVEAAGARFQPDEAAERAKAAAEHRHVRLDDDQSLAGTTHIDIEADTVDALAFDNTIGAIAEESHALGDSDSLDVRRAKAVGTIADPQTTLDLLDHPDDADTGTGDTEPEAEPEDADGGTATGAGSGKPARRNRSRGRRGRGIRLVVYLHLHQAAITGQITSAGTNPAAGTGTGTGTGTGHEGGLASLGRREHTGGDRPVLAEQVRTWMGRDDVSVSVQPVIDLNDTLTADSYEIPTRIKQHVTLRDRTCVFPWCERSARGTRGCDTDHITAYRPDADLPGEGAPPGDGPPESPPGAGPPGSGPPVDADLAEAEPQTSTDNLAPLCRRHHRIKTHGRWSYQMLEPGTFLWTSPHHQHYLREATGTRFADPAHPPDQ